MEDICIDYCESTNCKNCKYEYASKAERQIPNLSCQHKTLTDDICQILFEGENTIIGRQITIDRIKDIVDYDSWLEQ